MAVGIFIKQRLSLWSALTLLIFTIQGMSFAQAVPEQVAEVRKILGQALQAHHSLFQALHFVLAPAYALAVNLLHLIHMRMFPRIGHVAGEPR